MSEVIRAAIAAIVAGETLDAARAEGVMGAVLDGDATPAQIGALLVGIRMRTETADELTGFVRAMRARVIAVPSPPGTIDTCGTGGDVARTFNISTGAAIIASAAGVPIAKHGNRAVGSLSGSSDAMGALGLRVELTAHEAQASLAEEGFCFLHAPGFHPGMRHVGPIRRELAIRTFFNLCGPLANPAFPHRQLVGVGAPEAAEKVAHVLHALGVERAFVVHGDRIDELPLDDSGVIYDVTPAGVQRRTVTRTDHGLPHAPTEALAGGDGAANAAIIEAVLDGEETGPARDVLVLNAGAALHVAGRVNDLRSGVAAALETIASGAARAKLERLRARFAVVAEAGGPIG